MTLYHPIRKPTAQGHRYVKMLRCGHCDYVLESIHQGSNVRLQWEMRTCPNCKAKGIKAFLEPSLK